MISTRRRRLAVLLAGAALVSVSCRSGDSPSEASSATPDPSTEALAEASPSPTAEPIPLDAEQQAIVADVEMAMDRLLEAPAVEVTFVAANVDGGSAAGQVLIENETGNFMSREELTSDVNPDVQIVSELVLVGDEIFARIFSSDENPEDATWSRSKPDTLRGQFVDEVYTAQGAAGPSLDRMVVLLNQVPWILEGSAETDVDGVMVRSHLVRFEASEIWRFLRDRGLERVGPVEPEGATFFELWIDADEDVLVKTLAAGVQFQDGEPLPEARIEIDYDRMDEAQIVPPERIDE